MKLSTGSEGAVDNRLVVTKEVAFLADRNTQKLEGQI